MLLFHSVCSEVLGDAHSETITTRHNLAELFHAMGDETQAREVQEHILELLDVDPADIVEDTRGDSSGSEGGGEQEGTGEKEGARGQAGTDGAAEEEEDGAFAHPAVQRSASTPGRRRQSGSSADNYALAEQVERQAQRISDSAKSVGGGAAREESDDEIFGMGGDDEDGSAAKKQQTPPAPPLTFASRKNRPKKGA